ncbi:MAG TPA: phytoene desaturase family protein [Ktedonobacteraceae bacterium]|jgi:phytoene desaturase|nr:phytoene desaturase family protein [Ktedonobacteraceae bacterium]
MKQSVTLACKVASPCISRPRRVVVIGGGFGGLAAATRLQAAGCQVTLVEAREKLGGRAYQLQTEGFTFDMGPTLITAPQLLEDLWSFAGRELRADVDLIELSPFYRILFHDGRAFDYWGKTEQDEEEIACFEPRDVEGYRAFLAASKQLYERAFVELAAQPFLSLGSFLRVAPELLRFGAQRSVYATAARYFRDPQLRMVFSFHPLFIGGNPFRASSIYSIVPYLERLEGVYFACGGMYRIIEALESLFRSLGGEIRCGMPVTQILVKERRAIGVRLGDETFLAADAVVANSDVTQTYLHLLPAEARPRFFTRRLERSRYSMSCFLLYLGLKRQYPQLRHHTILMPRDYQKLVHEIFDGHGMPGDLALYLHTPTRTDPTLAPTGGESLYVLAPVPHLERGIDWIREAPVLRARILAALEQKVGLTGLTEHIVVERQFTPSDFASELRSHLGAAFSLEPTLTQSAYFRPHNRACGLGGLYFVGAGTHPGAGIPGVLLSAAVTSTLVTQDLEITGRNRHITSKAR